MSDMSIPEKYREMLRHHAHQYLLPAAKGEVKGLDPRKMKLGGGGRYWATAGFPAAHLAMKGLGPEREFLGSSELMDFAVACGDFFYRDWVGKGRTTLPNEHFATTFFLDLYELVHEQLSKARRERWRRAIQGHSEALSEALRSKLSVNLPRHSALQVGCGPNHLYCWCAMLYRGGRVLGRAEYRRRAAWAMHKLLAAQDASGYHAEHQGPVIHYHVVTLSGMWDYYAQSLDPASVEPLRRGAEFWCGMIYPDLTPIEVFDERNRWHPNYASSAQGALSMIPMGRRYISLALDKLLAGAEVRNRPTQERRLPWHVGWMLRVLNNYHEGPQQPLPIEDHRMLHRINGLGLVRRNRSWVHALSAFCNEPWEYNPFILDRVQNLSCWHEKTGLVIGGGNDKYAPEVATFYCQEGGFVGYYRPRSGRIVPARAEHGDRIELDYGPIRAALEVKPLNEGRMRIAADLRHWVLDLQPNLNLQLRLVPGSTLRLAGSKTVKLTRSTRKTRTIDTGGRVGTEQWELVGPKDMQLHWPHFPYNSYQKDRFNDIHAAVGIATVPFPREGGHVELELRIR